MTKYNPPPGFSCTHTNNIPIWPELRRSPAWWPILLLRIGAALAAAILLLSCSKDPNLPDPPPKDLEYWRLPKTPVEIVYTPWRVFHVERTAPPPYVAFLTRWLANAVGCHINIIYAKQFNPYPED